MQILLGLSKFIAILHCKLSCQCQILKYNKILKALKVGLGKVPLTERRFSKINGRVRKQTAKTIIFKSIMKQIFSF